MTSAVSHANSIRVHSPEATQSVAGALAAHSRAGDLLVLSGGLGAGKTIFAKGYAAGLGITDPVTSPTFVLMRLYSCPDEVVARGGPAFLAHADAYRLERSREIEDLDLAEHLEDGAAVLVEWGEAVLPALGGDHCRVAIELADLLGPDRDRRITIEYHGASWYERERCIGKALQEIEA